MIPSQSDLSRSTLSTVNVQGDPLAIKAPKKRTKSGCLTCRKRRIKCGEEKPVCKNCSKTKRACEQPATPVTLPRNRPARTQSLPNDANTLSPPHSSLQGVATQDEFPESRNGSGQLQSQSHELSNSPEAAHSLGSVSQHAAEMSYASVGFVPISRTYSLPSSHAVAFANQESLDSATHGQVKNDSFNLQFVSEALVSPGLSSHHDSEYFVQDHPGAYRLNRDMPTDDDNIIRDYSTRTSLGQVSSVTAASNHIGNLRTDRANARAANLGSGGMATEENQLWQDAGLQLTARHQHSFQHFIQNVNLNFTLLDEDLGDLPDHIHIRPSNFWSYVIPTMAMQSEPLFHAVVAISALHETNVERKSEHTALMDYHVAIKKLGNALLEPGAFERDDLLSACLVLAYFETMHGEIVRWGRHLQGAGDIVQRRIRNQYTSNEQGLYKFTANPTIADHLIWFHIHQDAIQSVLSGDGLFLDLEWIEMCPVRGEPGSVTHKSDQLRVFLARIGDFASKDRMRKQKSQDENALIAATVRWETLMSTLTGWRAQLGPIFSSSAVRNTATPFGTALIFSHPAIASCQIMSLAALLYLHRSHPMYSHVPAEAIRACAAETYMIGHDIIRILSGIMVEGVNNKTIDNGSHVKAMINAVLPVFLAGIAVQDEERRNYVDRLVQDVYTFTGWRTAFRVLQGLDVAWQRPTRDFGWRCENEIAGTEHERSSTVPRETPYLERDRFDMLNYASGVLGRKKIVSPDRYPPQESTLATSTSTGPLPPLLPPPSSAPSSTRNLGIAMDMNDASSTAWPTSTSHLDVDPSMYSQYPPKQTDRADHYRHEHVGEFGSHSLEPWPTGSKLEPY